MRVLNVNPFLLQMQRRRQMPINAPAKYQQMNNKGYNKRTAIVPSRI